MKIEFRRRFGLIGKTLSHSFSKHYFQNKFQHHHLDDCTYDNLEFATEEELIAQWNTLKEQYHGLNITLPYKKTLIPYLDDIDPVVKSIGAINCIAITERKAMGYNTDQLGFYHSLEGFPVDHRKKALILGNGGASQAIQYVFHSILNMDYDITDRSGFHFPWENINQLHLSLYSIIVHTTPIGMYPAENDFPTLNYQSIDKDTLAIDLIYNPKKTLFLQKMEENGAHIINGEKMLIEQAEESWRIWTKNLSTH